MAHLDRAREDVARVEEDLARAKEQVKLETAREKDFNIWFARAETALLAGDVNRSVIATHQDTTARCHQHLKCSKVPSIDVQDMDQVTGTYVGGCCELHDQTCPSCT